MHENDLSGHVIDCCIKLHKKFGPGVYERVYEALLVHELAKRGIHCQRQVACPLVYEGLHFDEAYAIDVLVEDKVILELKSVDELHPKHFKQLTTYLKLKNKRLGLLINFGEELMKDGIHRIVNGLDDPKEENPSPDA